MKNESPWIGIMAELFSHLRVVMADGGVRWEMMRSVCESASDERYPISWVNTPITHRTTTPRYLAFGGFPSLCHRRRPLGIANQHCLKLHAMRWDCLSPKKCIIIIIISQFVLENSRVLNTNFPVRCCNIPTSGRLIQLLIVSSPRLLCYSAAFSRPTLTTFGKHINTSHRSFGKTAINAMDEVAAAKEAAAKYKPSDGDGAGPDTVFDKLLRYL